MEHWIFLLCVIFLIWYFSHEIFVYCTRKEACSSQDNRCYSIVGHYEPNTHEQASQLLAQLNIFNLQLIEYMRDKYLWYVVPVIGETQKSMEYKRRMTELLLLNYNPDNIIENDPINSINTSYVENKGKVFAICLREKKSGENRFHDIDTLKFIVLHEMAHLSTELIGHEMEFWTNFKILTQEATNCGIYNPVDFMSNPINYCHLDIAYNPYYDNYIKIPK